MKSHGKDKGICLNDPLKTKLANVSKGCPRIKWIPLFSWPACPHPNPDVQRRLDEYRSMPSRWT